MRRDFDFTEIALTGELPSDGQILLDGVPDVEEGLLFRLALRPATAQARAGHTETVFGPGQGDGRDSG